VPIGDRLVPLMVFYAVVMAALYYPAASLVEEREHRTLDALLVSPVRMRDVLAAKGIVATVLAVAMAMVTLALNRAFGGQALLLAGILTIGAVMLAEGGLVLGLWARDANTMFTAIKGSGIIVFLPTVFAIWPDLPQWIARVVPTYYFLMPVYDVGVLGQGLGDVWVDVAIGAAICAALAPLVAAYARKAERRMAVSA
jgi:ABC-2 type transport system permease protein